MIKAKYIGVSNDLLQTGKEYEIVTYFTIWGGKPKLRVSFGERARYCVHYGGLENFLKYWNIEEVYHG